jgi:hypothetical protein
MADQTKKNKLIICVNLEVSDRVQWCNRMISVLASSAIVAVSSPDRVKPKTIELVFDASPLSTQPCMKEKEQRMVGSESG